MPRNLQHITISYRIKTHADRAENRYLLKQVPGQTAQPIPQNANLSPTAP
ncbi:hypothetical protein [Edaphobacter aggregans]|nr:hypothetical protein [Edaphobacter aggregans]